VEISKATVFGKNCSGILEILNIKISTRCANLEIANYIMVIML